MVEPSNRFQDQNLRLTDFQKEVWVVCPQCAKKAIAKVDYETQKAKLLCTNCGFSREKTTALVRQQAHFILPAHAYFDAELWLQMSFKNDVFWAYNDTHLVYLEQFIAAKLREHKDRSHFTLLEKLPKFYHEAKNREPLLKLIDKLKKK